MKDYIGIIGNGMVGSAVAAHFPDAVIYDPKTNPDGWEAVDNCMFVFLCVPTPYHVTRGYDMRAILSTAKKLTGEKVIILKSTVLPGTTTYLQRKFPKHTWLFNPEFLRDKSATQDFLKPDRQIVGKAANTTKHQTMAEYLIKILPKAKYREITTSTEAELIKQFANAFLATKVIFSNMMFDVCQQTGATYDRVKYGVGSDPRITTSMMDVQQDGYRGYSGKCFPKDMGAMIWWANHTKHHLPLLELVDIINQGLLPTELHRR